jgi:hypothetical protein
MASSNGGGRRRGRPVTLSPEQRLANRQRRGRRKQANRRKREADREWLRVTNHSYMDTCSVIHWGQFVDYLIYAGLLKEVDAETPARIEKATDALLEHRVQEWAPALARLQARLGWEANRLQLCNAAPLVQRITVRR